MKQGEPVLKPLDQKRESQLSRLFQGLQQGESRYKKLIDSQDSFFGGTQAAFSEITLSKLDAIQKLDQGENAYFDSRLRNNILIDLGGGRSCHMLPSADFYAASGYVNVDKYVTGGFRDLPYDPSRNQFDAFWANPARKGGDWGETPHSTSTEPAIVHADMLDFIARLPDNSVNFTMNGIDYDILGDGAENIAYQIVLAHEMVRALRPGGIIFGVNFEPIVDKFTSGKDTVSPEYERLGLREHKVHGERYTSLSTRWNNLLVYEKNVSN